MLVSVSKLRSDIYRLLDQVLETGEPIEIERKGRKLKIIPERSGDRLSNLRRRDDYLKSAPESIVHLDWTEEWHRDLP
jgi:PHD/YefM family antitoxin component YafN of YafNO toxin-antitoxin module